MQLEYDGGILWIEDKAATNASSANKTKPQQEQQEMVDESNAEITTVEVKAHLPWMTLQSEDINDTPTKLQKLLKK